MDLNFLNGSSNIFQKLLGGISIENLLKPSGYGGDRNLSQIEGIVSANPSETFTLATGDETDYPKTDPIDYTNYNNLIETEPADEDETLLAYEALSEGTKQVLMESPQGEPGDEGLDDIEPETEEGKSEPEKIRTPAPEPHPEHLDNTTIEMVTIRWITASDGDDEYAAFDRLELRPQADTVTDHQFQINFSISGEDTFEPGEVEVVIPAHIWKTREGEEPGELTLALPMAPDEKAEFVWTRIGDNIVITNNKVLSAASRVTIQGTFRNIAAHDLIDDSESADLQATVTVQTPQGNSLSYTSNTINAHIDTFATVSSASKTGKDTYNDTYDVWWSTVPSELPEELWPENPENYVYVRWYATGTAAGNQPYTMTITDTIHKIDGKREFGGLMLGATNTPSGTVKADANYETVEAILFEGYSATVKGCYIWTAYPKSEFEKTEEIRNNIQTLHNEQTITCYPIDEVDEPTQKSASAEVLTRVPNQWTFIKYWDDNNNAAGHRPGSLSVTIRKTKDGKVWEYVTLTPNNADPEYPDRWIYEWTDENYLGSFRATETLPSSGLFGSWFDDKDTELRHWWEYFQVSNVVNEGEHSITITNSYREPWGNIPVSDSYMTKDVESAYEARSQEENRNTGLQDLLRDNQVTIKYNMSTRLYAKFSRMNEDKEFVLEDTEYTLGGRKFSSDDISITSVVLRNPSAYKYVETTGHEDDPHYNPDYHYAPEYLTPPPAEELWILVDGEEQWRKVATLENSVVTPEPGSGIIVSGMTVTMPDSERVIKAKLVMRSDEAVCATLGMTVGLTIYPTEDIKEFIHEQFDKQGDYISLGLQNTGEGYILDKDGKKVESKIGSDTGHLYGRRYKVAVELAKSFKMAENDILNRRVKLHTTLTLTQQSNVLKMDEYLNALAFDEIPNTRTGTYYDLLPPEINPDFSTLRTTNPDEQILEVYTLPNYKDSGRTLLVVKVSLTDNISYTSRRRQNDINYPEKGYANTHTLDFDSYLPWELIDVGQSRYAINLAAYEADEDIIGNFKNWEGEPDNPQAGNNALSGNESKNFDDLMTGLDPTREPANAFVYARDKIDLRNIDIYAVAALYKHVQKAGDEEWSDGYTNDDVNVEEGGAYTYRLWMRSFTDTSMKDIIILDSLENYVPYGIDKDTGDTQWRGSLTSIDVHQLEDELGVDPVIYYSTTPNLDLSGYNPGQEAGVVKRILTTNRKDWSTVPPEDLSKVTAIAVDATKRKDGTDFVLEGGEHLAIYLNMVAPYEIDNDNPEYFKGTNGAEHKENAHAYNNVYLDCFNSTNWGVETQNYINYSYTKVGIYTKSLTVNKVWDDDDNRDGYRPESIRVELLKNGEHTGEYKTLSDENGWTATFRRIHTYDSKGNYINYSFSEEFPYRDQYELKNTVIQQEDGNLSVILTNKHDPNKISLPVVKFWDDDEARAENTTDTEAIEGQEISAVSEESLEETPEKEDVIIPESTRPEFVVVRLYADGVDTGLSLTLTAENNWSGTFEGLLKFRDQGEEIVYTIGEVEVNDYKLTRIEWDEENGEFHITNTYDPRGNLLVKKTVENGTDAVEGKDFEFEYEIYTENPEDPVNPKVYLNGEFHYALYDKDGEILESSDPEETEDPKAKVQGSGTFSLKDGQYILIKDLPTHFKFHVVEKSAAGFTAAPEEAYGDILSYTTQTAEFVNTYHSRGSVELSAQKDITGIALEANRYQFILTDITDPDNPITLTQPRNDINGNVNFGQITYTEADHNKTFKYEIKELIVDRPGYTYDETLYYAYVTPEGNGNGTMGVFVTYEDSQGNSYEEPDFKPVFINSYNAEETVTLRAWKSITARTPEENEFEFGLYSYDLNTQTLQELDRRRNNANSTVDFNIDFTQENRDQTFFYIIREISDSSSDPNIIYDNRLIGYRVAVTDNGNGTLAIDQNSFNIDRNDLVLCPTCQADESSVETSDCDQCAGVGFVLRQDYEVSEENTTPVFENDQQPGVLEISKTAELDEDQYPSQKDREFNFKLKLTGENLPDNLSYTKENTEAKSLADSSTIKTLNAREITPINNRSINSDIALLAGSSQGEISPINFPEIIAEGTSGTIKWIYNANKELIVSSVNGISGSITSKVWESNAAVKKNEIIKVSFNGNVSLPSSLTSWFSEYTALQSIDLSQAVFPNGVNLKGLFKNCSNLKDVNFGRQNIVPSSLQEIFSGCTSIQILDLSSINTTGKSFDMCSAFYGCSSLQILDISGIDLTVNTSCWLENFFYGCTKLKQINFNDGFFKNTAQQNSRLIEGKFKFPCNGHTWENMDDPLKKASTQNNPTTNTLKQWSGGWWHCTDPNCAIGGFYTITFVNDLDPDAASFKKLALEDRIVTIESGIFSHQDFELIGWRNQDDPSKEYYYNDNGYAVIPEGSYKNEDEVILVPIWLPKDAETYELILDGKGESSVTRMTRRIPISENFLISNFGFTRPGFDLVAWQNEEGTIKYKIGEIIPAFTYSRDESLTLYPIWGQLSSMNDDHEFDFTLRDRQKAVFEDLPAGTIYEVWEETPDGWVLVSSNNTSGTIQSNETSTASFYNKYDPAKTKALLRLNKFFDGIPTDKDYDNHPFEFALYQSELGEDGTPTVNLLETKTALPGGSIQFELEYDDSLESYETPVDYHYVVREVVDTPQETIDYDTKEIFVTVQVAKNSEGVLTSTVTYDDGDSAFNNSTKPGSLSIKKTTSGETFVNTEKVPEFTFNVSLFDKNNTPIPNGTAFNYEILGPSYPEVESSQDNSDSSEQPNLETGGYESSDEEGESESFTYSEETDGPVEEGQDEPSAMLITTGNILTITLRADQTVKIYGLAQGTHYTVEEVNLPDGWTLSESNDTETFTGSIEADKISEVFVDNTYSYATVGKASLEAYKSFDGMLVADQFAFRLLDENLNIVESVDQVWNREPEQNEDILNENNELVPNPTLGMAPVRFDLSFSQPGNYIYYVEEVDLTESDPSVYYDSHLEKYSVTVTDTGLGTLETTVTPEGSYQLVQEETPEGITRSVEKIVEVRTDSYQGPLFKNTQKFGGISVTKTLSNALPDDYVGEPIFVFDLTLKDKEGNPIEETYDYVILDQEGNIVVPKIKGSYDETGSDNPETDEGPRSENDQGTENTEDTEPEVPEQVVRNGEATISLKAGQTFVIENLPFGTEYEIVERSQPNFQLVSSAGSTGTITDKKEEINFVNAYTVPGEFYLTAQKYLDGKAEIPEETFKFELYMDGKFVEEQYADSEGKVTFNKIEFEDSMWNREFKIKELFLDKEGNFIGDPRYNYDAHEELIYVDVIGQEDGSFIVNRRNATEDIPVFNNTTKLGGLSVSKTVVADQQIDTEREFGFTVTLSDTTINGWYGDMFFEEGVAVFSLKHSEALTATDLPVGITYTVEEAEADGYTQSSTIKTGTITEETKEENFINIETTTGLMVTKRVTGEAGETVRDFNFRVELSDTTINGPYGSMDFEDGIAEFTLRSGETKVAIGLPEGVSYTVVEEEYNQDGYETTVAGDGTLSESGDVSGDILADAISKVEFTNHRDKIPEALGNLQIKKTVTGDNAEMDRAFSFRVKLSDSSVSGAFGDLNFVYGIASFTLKDGESVTATGLPAGLTYYVEEFDNAGYAFIASGETGTIKENETVVADITNERGYGGLSVTKTVEGSTIDQQKAFTFTVTLSDTSINGKFGQMDFENGVAKFTLKHGQTVTANDLPSGLAYKVVESDNGDYLVGKVNDQGLIPFDEIVSADFTNTKLDETISKIETTVNGEVIRDEDLTTDSHGGVTGPIVAVGSTISYQIHWINISQETGDVIITDLLDHGVDFESATDGGVYDPVTHMVTWKLENQEPGADGYVGLTIKVNDDADIFWDYDEDDASYEHMDSGILDEFGTPRADHRIVNKAKVTVNNEVRETNAVYNGLEGLFIEKIHVIVGITGDDEKYLDVFEDRGVYDLPKDAFNPNDGLGFTNKLDQDTEVNDYKKTFTHDPGNTVRYYIKVTNNYKTDLKHVVIMDPVRVNSLQYTNDAQTKFYGVAGTVNNDPEVEGRTQSYVNVEPISVDNNDIVTFRVTSNWNEDWGDADVRIENNIPTEYAFVSAFYHGLDEEAVVSLQASDIDTETLTGKVEGTGEYADSSIELSNNTITWKYSITAQDPETDNVMYVRLQIPGAQSMELSKLPIGTYGGFIKNNLKDDKIVGRTNNIKAIYNQDDIDRDNTSIEENNNEGYLRWEIETLPGTETAGREKIASDGYPSNVQIVYFNWDMPEGVSEFSSWKNTAYVQTMAELEENLERLYPIEYGLYKSLLEKESAVTGNIGIYEADETPDTNSDPEIEPDEEQVEIPEENPEENPEGELESRLYTLLSLNKLVRVQEDTEEPEEAREKDYKEPETPEENQSEAEDSDIELVDSSTGALISIYSQFGWNKLSQGMMSSNTVMEVINAGRLEISKEIVGNIDENTEFTFNINLDFKNILSSSEDPEALTGDYAILDEFGNATGYAIKNGSGSFKLKGGQKVYIENLPLRTHFMITETNSEKYLVTGSIDYPADESAGQKGTTVGTTGAVIDGDITLNNANTKVRYVNELKDEPYYPSNNENPKDEPQNPGKDPEKSENEPDKPESETQKPGNSTTNKPVDNSTQNTVTNNPENSNNNSSETETSVSTVTSSQNPNGTTTTPTKTGVTQTGVSPQTGVTGGLSVSFLLIIAVLASSVDAVNRKRSKKE